MYRTIYDTTTGRIIICRRINDELLAERLLKFPNQAALNVHTTNIDNYKVDLDTLTIVANLKTENVTLWLRNKRKADLMSCDWTQTTDAPLSESKKAEWATYRQALRDMPATYPNVTDRSQITWPAKPE